MKPTRKNETDSIWTAGSAAALWVLTFVLGAITFVLSFSFQTVLASERFTNETGYSAAPGSFVSDIARLHVGEHATVKLIRENNTLFCTVERSTAETFRVSSCAR